MEVGARLAPVNAIKDMSIKQALEKQKDGIVADVFQADQAYALLKQIGECADRINHSGYGHFFAPIQDILVRDYVLAITKIFDRPDKNYPTRGIPTMIGLIRDSSKELKIYQRPAMLKRLAFAGLDITAFERLTDAQITLALVDFYATKLPSKDKVDGFKAWRTLEALKFRRNKAYAHNESFDHSMFPETTWQETQELVQLARSFTSVVCTGYLSFILTSDDGMFFLSNDAKRASRSLSKLLVKAGVVDSM